MLGKIRKLQVTDGVFWVEIPDENLRILCGCPGDSVKHLMKRGLIAKIDVNGQIFETGPNAILLSDVGLQNGQFSNLAEFPVLQMLYNQGMIIPGHPGNNGNKPLLIGSAEQIKAQLEYIFRGNYGLASEKELMEAGVSLQESREMMQIKLRFAFGKIRKSIELVTPCLIDDSIKTLKGAVQIRRLKLNVFEFLYNGDSTVIDLNLSGSAIYEPPYPLGFHNLPREYFAVVHSGNGDGWDVNRPSMASILMFQGRIYLIDCGPNINGTLRALGIGIHEIEGVFHTHCHDDHFAGLTFLVRSDKRIKYYATKPVQASVAKKLSALMSMSEQNFYDYFDVHNLNQGEWNNIEGLEVKPVYSPHPVETTVLFFSAMATKGRKTYAHMADIASREVLQEIVKTDRNVPGMSKKRLDKVISDYIEPVNIKKLDVGGGMIHGNAEDFRYDKSEKIILAHTSRPLSDSQKEIGSGAPFGSMDVLIPTYQDYLRRYAANFLFDYLIDIPDDHVRMLLNQPVDTFNPETIMLREGDKVDEIFLILSGSVEMLDSRADFQGILSAGVMIGEIQALLNKTLKETYRSTNFVNTLTIPSSLYQTIGERFGIVKKIRKYAELRDFLLRTWLFGENLAAALQTKIAESMKIERWKKGENPGKINSGTLYMIKKGSVETIFQGTAVERLKRGNFFGEDSVLFHGRPKKKLKVLSDTEVFTFPGKVLLDIPVVRWKLVETYQRRLQYDPSEVIIKSY